MVIVYISLTKIAGKQPDLAKPQRGITNPKKGGTQILPAKDALIKISPTKIEKSIMLSERFL